MPLPTLNDLQAVEPILTNLLIGFKQADSRFVAGRLFPSVPVDKDSGTFFTLTQHYWFSDEMKSRAPGSKFERGGFGVSTDTYKTIQYGLEYLIADEIRNNSQLPMALETLGAQYLAQQSLIRKERAWAADFMTTSVWTTQDNNSTTDWDDFESGDPVKDIRTARRGINQLTGMSPNTMMVGEEVWDALSLHPDVIDRLKYTTAASTASVEGALAGILGVGSLIVALAQYQTANEGAANTTAVYDPIIDDDALLLYSEPNPGLFSATAGLTFTWSGGGGDGQVATYRDQSTKSDVLQAFEQWDQKVISAALGAIWLDVV